MTVSRKTVERSLFGAGAALCLFYFGVTAHRSFASRLAVQTFEAKSTRKATTGKDVAVKLPSSAVALPLRGAKRIAVYRDSLVRQFSPPIAVLLAATVGIEVPVFDGTDEFVLNRAPDASPGPRARESRAIPELQAIGTAFSGLSKMSVGDSVTLETGADLTAYVVENINVVTPADVSVLARTTTPP